VWCTLALAAACADADLRTESPTDAADASVDEGTHAARGDAGPGDGGAARPAMDAAAPREQDAAARPDAQPQDGGRVATTDAGHDAGPPPAPDAGRDAGEVEPTPGTYEAEGWVGGLWHVDVVKLVPSRGYCAVVHLVYPSPSTDDELAITTDWAAAPGYAVITDDEACLPSSGPRVEVFRTTGTVTLRGGPRAAMPASLDIDVEVLFLSHDGGVIPVRERLLASDLPIVWP